MKSTVPVGVKLCHTFGNKNVESFYGLANISQPYCFGILKVERENFMRCGKDGGTKTSLRKSGRRARWKEYSLGIFA